MTKKLLFPVFIPYDQKSDLLGIVRWGEAAGLKMKIDCLPDQSIFAIEAWTHEGVLASNLFRTIKTAASRDVDGATYASIRNYSFLRTSVPERTLEWAIDQLCRTGELVRIDGVHKQSGKPLPRYKLGEVE